MGAGSVDLLVAAAAHSLLLPLGWIILLIALDRAVSSRSERAGFSVGGAEGPLSARITVTWR
jgi:hypothetical protein